MTHVCSSATALPAPAEACGRIGVCELTACARFRGSAARSEDGDLAPGQLPRSMSLGSDAGFNADSKYEYRPQPLAATQGLRCAGSDGLTGWMQKFSSTFAAGGLGLCLLQPCHRLTASGLSEFQVKVGLAEGAQVDDG